MSFYEFGLIGLIAGAILLKIYKYRVLKIPFRCFIPIKLMDERERYIRLRISRVTTGFYDLAVFGAILVCVLIFKDKRASQLLMLIYFSRYLVYQASDLYYRRGEDSGS